MKIHLIYLAVIISLLAIIGSLTISKIFEKVAVIQSTDKSDTYKLRMLASGDLIFEKHKYLPLASFQDYWGDMSVKNVEWLSKHQVHISMNDGTLLNIKMGEIEVNSPSK